ncbi:MAG: YraN family protein [Blastocatellia bacterium]|nr:YraN family protein [Blastocatellia bacterium]
MATASLSIANAPEARVIPLGERGEKIAAEFLAANGYRIVFTNFKVPIGRNSKGVARSGEIDIVALDGETLCFIEVKTRRSEDFTPAIASVDVRKRIQITRTARTYRAIFNITDTASRFDVVTVLMPKHAEVSIELKKGFWSEQTLRSAVRHGRRDDIPF